MEKDRKKDASMDTTQPEDVSPPYQTPLGSLSYSPPPLEGRSEEEMGKEVKGEDDPDKYGDEETDEEVRIARRKAKGKAKASPSPPPPEEEEEEEDYDDDDDDDNNKENKRPSKSPRSANSNSITSSPAAEVDNQMDMDMDDYCAREAREAIEIAARETLEILAREQALGYGGDIKFGDVDAAMNDALSASPSPSWSSYSKENENNTSPVAPSNSPERHETGWVGESGGGGRGRGRGAGWGLDWQETSTREEEDWGGWSAHDDPPPSPPEQMLWAESRWEEYDFGVWEKAAQEVAEKEREKPLTVKEPHSTLSVKTVSMNEKGEGSTKRSKEEDSTRQRGELVRAVRDYKAILPGTFLSYEKDDVMRVLHRHSDGKLFNLLPLKNRASSGRAHTKNFVLVPDNPADADSPSKESSRGQVVERKGG
ncbi:MAG: hypothetical protein Q9161_000979 [Pseudevernia consocians]